MTSVRRWRLRFKAEHLTFDLLSLSLFFARPPPSKDSDLFQSNSGKRNIWFIEKQCLLPLWITAAFRHLDTEQNLGKRVSVWQRFNSSGKTGSTEAPTCSDDLHFKIGVLSKNRFDVWTCDSNGTSGYLSFSVYVPLECRLFMTSGLFLTYRIYNM